MSLDEQLQPLQLKLIQTHLEKCFVDVAYGILCCSYKRECQGFAKILQLLNSKL